MDIKEIAEELANNPELARKLQVEMQKKNAGALAKAGSPVSEPKHTSYSAKLLTELAEKNGFDPDATSMEYTGSDANYSYVKYIIANKYGDDIAEEYEPTVQVKPKTAWLQAGYLLKKDEKPLCYITTWRNKEPHSVALYHELQMIKG